MGSNLSKTDHRGLIEGNFSMDGHLTLNLVIAYVEGKLFKGAHEWSF